MTFPQGKGILLFFFFGGGGGGEREREREYFNIIKIIVYLNKSHFSVN